MGDSPQDAEELSSSVTLPATAVTGSFLPLQGAEGVTGDRRYATLGLLGQGGMAKVHLCRDEWIGREVAMKVILPKLRAETASHARFLREASVQGQLEHPSIVPVHDLGTTPRATRSSR